MRVEPTVQLDNDLLKRKTILYVCPIISVAIDMCRTLRRRPFFQVQPYKTKCTWFSKVQYGKRDHLNKSSSAKYFPLVRHCSFMVFKCHRSTICDWRLKLLFQTVVGLNKAIYPSESGRRWVNCIAGCRDCWDFSPCVILLKVLKLVLIISSYLNIQAWLASADVIWFL